MMSWLRQGFWLLLASLVAFFVGQFIGSRGHPSGQGPPVVIHDTVPVIRVDTVLSSLERVIYREVPPETVVVYRERVRVDTVYGLSPESILALWKHGSLLKIQAVSAEGQVREYTYRLSPYSTTYSVFTKGHGFFRPGTAPIYDGQAAPFRHRLDLSLTAGAAGDWRRDRLSPIRYPCLDDADLGMDWSHLEVKS